MNCFLEVALFLRQLNPTHKKGPWRFLLFFWFFSSQADFDFAWFRKESPSSRKCFPWVSTFLKHAGKMFINRWRKLFSICSSMVLFCCNYTLSCAFLNSFSSETEIKSLCRLSPGHSSWRSKRFILWVKLCLSKKNPTPKN